MREQLIEICERLELQRISSRVEKKHRRLLAHLALKPSVRFDHERHPSRTNALSHLLPRILCEHDTEVRNRHLVAIHRIASSLPARSKSWPVMRDDLVAEQIKIDPVFGAAPLRTT